MRSIQHWTLNSCAIASVALLFFTSCKKETEKQFSIKYFDIKSYFEKEAARMQHQNLSITKKIEKNNITENNVFYSVDWKNELKSFTECDINRPAWLQSYRIDSAISNEKAIIKYSAKDSSLNISLIQIIFSEITPVSIHIIRKNNNRFFTNESYLSFIAGKGYSIDIHQKISFTKSMLIKIEATFIKPKS